MKPGDGASDQSRGRRLETTDEDLNEWTAGETTGTGTNGPRRSTKVIGRCIVGAALAAAALSACSSDTAGLSVGDCVHVEAADFTIGGDVGSVSCDEVEFLRDNYRVVSVGSESEMEADCFPPDLVIVDGDDAACLTQ